MWLSGWGSWRQLPMPPLPPGPLPLNTGLFSPTPLSWEHLLLHVPTVGGRGVRFFLMAPIFGGISTLHRRIMLGFSKSEVSAPGGALGRGK